jgi:membrane protease YdiL (CAAX protease family)
VPLHGGARLRWHLCSPSCWRASPSARAPAGGREGVAARRRRGTRTLLLNGIAGLVFGWFYVRHGLESAMLSHFCADLVLHVAAPLAMA